MKKPISICLAILILTLLTVPAYAVDAGNYTTKSVMSPQFTYIWQMSAGLGINSSGKALCAGSVDVASMTYSAELTVTLERNINDSWSTVKSWTGTGVGPGLIVEKEYYVVQGTYRVKTTAKVYSSEGTLLETQSIYSAEKTY